MEAQIGVNLQPHTLVELIDRAFRLYRNNFIKFVGIVAIALVPVQLISLLLNFLSYQALSSQVYNTANATSFSFRTLGISVLILLLTAVFVSGVANAALTSAITSSYLGEKITIGSAFSKIRKSWGRLLGALLLLSLLIILFFIWTIIPCVGWFTGLGILTFITLAVSPLIAPVIVIENRSGMNAIRRAWDLVRRRFWWIIGYFLLLFVFNLLVIQGPVQLIATLIQNSISTPILSAQHITVPYVQLIFNSITTLLLSLIYIPLQSSCATLVYFDLRIRQEGFDLAMMANQTSESPLNAVDLAGQTSGAAVGRLVTWAEIGYFVAITVGAIAFYFILAFIIAGSRLSSGLY